MDCAVTSWGEGVRRQVAAGEWRLGPPDNAVGVGLMTSQAGIGNQLLRIAHRGKLPSLRSPALPSRTGDSDQLDPQPACKPATSLYAVAQPAW